MLLDLLVHPDGLRLRDGISHGEVCLLTCSYAIVMLAPSVYYIGGVLQDWQRRG